MPALPHMLHLFLFPRLIAIALILFAYQIGYQVVDECGHDVFELDLVELLLVKAVIVIFSSKRSLYLCKHFLLGL